METDPGVVDNFFTDPDHESIEPPYTNVKNDMIGNLQSLKDDYLIQGGEDPEFV